MKNTKYSRISPEQRYQISTLRKAGYSLEFIAKQIGKLKRLYQQRTQEEQLLKRQIQPQTRPRILQ